MALKPRPVSLADARRIWLRAQRLDSRETFGTGPAAVLAAIEQLGYVQIDTINVIERSHHHILFSRIPAYRRADLHHAQTVDKTVFEYWTHALAYVPTRDLPFFVPLMKAFRAEPIPWYEGVPDQDVRRVLTLIRKDGPVTLRDIDDVPVEKTHPWGSRKPSKGALQRGFFEGRLAISERTGMLKTYELLERHFGWSRLPRAATPKQELEYRLDRALRSQGLISAPSVMHPRLRFSPELAQIVERRVRSKELVEVALEGGDTPHYATPEVLDKTSEPASGLVHILSPFDPLVIQRRRLKLFFGYDHVFEAYTPKAKRKFGYFTLPVLVGDQMVAALDLKTDRAAGKLLIQAWHWLDAARPRSHKRLIEDELQRFERFQLGA
ncbi:MAG: YcaQ family DNA glycosylase [Devosia nanyangense]|uniref:YcaQ family DNA glycosylase n=1 Tax=Devosia nanyangense TaxID=1228055 RepID=A0A933KYU7_9HYPH|nr:YcaQ family DNA glycosylase [Devosia nanyangense]